MINGKSVVAIIPARGGSKGLPRKNVLPLAGKPLIVWSIEAAENSRYIDRHIISTDDEEIASVARENFGEVPFIRPEQFSTDQSSSYDVLEHAILFLKEENHNYDYVVLLEPTSPLRTSEDIDRALEYLHNNKNIADSIVGVSHMESTHPVFSIRINPTGLISPFKGKVFQILRRQEIEELFFFEGTVYVSKVNALMEQKTFYHNKTLPYIVPRWKSLEIDEMIDLICAEAILKNLEKLEG